MNYTGIILAGGNSSRMGQNKALMYLNGKRIIEYLFEMFSEFCCEVIISTNEPELYSFLKAKTQKDNYLNIGPIAGIQACLAVSSNEINFISSCDTPFVSKEMFLYLLEKSQNAKISTPTHFGISEPIIGMFRKETATDFENAIKQTIFSPSKTEKIIGQTFVEISDSEQIFNNKLFTNINTMDDLQTAERFFKF
jgi:molybdopterin-guanine dinucleotide biosynthesis protein A